ncbi:MAG: hypothetical protein QOF60_1402 [Actinomycetota bacterium]|jgi:uncharacterized protein YndB with AHSA1/START domain|nr:hypothetical protein [Actinomycetota bacterium]
MEFGTIERELHIGASPEVVFDVISSPEHIREWWSAETEIEPIAGSTSDLTWRDQATGAVNVVSITVIDVQPPRLFAFRWTQEPREAPTPSNSLLVTFELTPSDDGTVLRFTETGFRERGWDTAELERTYQDHVSGWDFYLPRIAERAAGQTSAP